MTTTHSSSSHVWPVEAFLEVTDAPNGLWCLCWCWSCLGGSSSTTSPIFETRHTLCCHCDWLNVPDILSFVKCLNCSCEVSWGFGFRYHEFWCHPLLVRSKLWTRIFTRFFAITKIIPIAIPLPPLPPRPRPRPFFCHPSFFVLLPAPLLAHWHNSKTLDHLFDWGHVSLQPKKV